MTNHLHRSRQNYFTSNPLDRLATHRPTINLQEIMAADAPTYVVPVWQGKHLMKGSDPVFVPIAQAQHLVQDQSKWVFLGTREAHHYFAIEVAEEAPDEHPFWQQQGNFEKLRQASQAAERAEAAILGYAQAMLYWNRNHLYCGRCGSATENQWAGHVRVCSNIDCGKKHYPRTDPAIITMITYQNQALLVRQPHWQPSTRLSLVAGFVEPGESLEEAVQREVMEEVGLEINQVQYQSSQPWPFPGSIMLGFKAQATHQAFELLDQELEAARWFTRAQLKEAVAKEEVLLSSPISISGVLINAWLNEEETEMVVDTTKM
ncbi:NAD(+) diphosphatase [uncultured Microscilla sp.]|uniref:NAD(+) diphosphatase n=1 Tax=uncultured Microscilla sp. TaxID=432653 RepID=UPI0026395165|nr:NAD(+) diphosphatase [uncultured Microscilla sp.]